jgi:hypothetical protein
MLHSDCEVAELAFSEVGIFDVRCDYDYVDLLTFTKEERFRNVVRVKHFVAGKSKLLRDAGIAVSCQTNERCHSEKIAPNIGAGK